MRLDMGLNHQRQRIEIGSGPTIQAGVKKSKGFKMNVGICKCGNHAFAAEIFNRTLSIDFGYLVSGVNNFPLVFNQRVKQAVVILAGDKVRIFEDFHIYAFSLHVSLVGMNQFDYRDFRRGQETDRRPPGAGTPAHVECRVSGKQRKTHFNGIKQMG